MALVIVEEILLLLQKIGTESTPRLGNAQVSKIIMKFKL